MPSSPRKSAPSAGAAGPFPRLHHLERIPAGPQEAASGRCGRNERNTVSDRRPLRNLAAVFVLQPYLYTEFSGFRIGVCSRTFRGLDRFDPPASPRGAPRPGGRFGSGVHDGFTGGFVIRSMEATTWTAAVR